MPTRRNPLKHHTKLRVSERAALAWRRGDFHELHNALGLKPWETSPLPVAITALGVHQGDPPEWLDSKHGRADWLKAQELQRHLYAVAGDPGRESVSE